MKLAAGTKLGPYEIQHTIGAGGMGIVYRADDSRLGRKVAIKILPHAEGEHLKRFEREARTIGSLNHPNLLTLFDIGNQDGTPFLVTELLDGDSLRAKLSKSRMRIREAIQIAAEVARGLAAAHDAGVIHRDVKPDNIFITTEGRIKILDFGIAKLRKTTIEDDSTADSASDIGKDATLTPTATTDTGMMIGTPGYMAPEQLDGGNIDGRTDIFALGVVLYEMISGKRAFASTSPIEESYAILKATPDPPAGATKAIARVVLRCLEKRPEARFQSANDLAFALDELDASTDPVARISVSDLETAESRRPPPRSDFDRKRALRWAGIAALVLATGAAGLLVGKQTSAPTGIQAKWPTIVEGGPAYRRVTYHSQTRWFARLAPPDGASVLYSADRDGKTQVMRSQIANPSILPLNIEGRLLDVSMRGELAVVVEKVSEGGGALSRVFEGAGSRSVTEGVTAAAFYPDGERLAIVRNGTTLEAPIGTVLAQRTTGRIGLIRVSPSGDRIAYVDHPADKDTRGQVIVLDASGKQVAQSSAQTGIEGIAWSPDGTEVWYSNGPIVTGLAMTRKERVVLRGIMRHVLTDVAAGKILVAPSDIRLKMFTGAPRQMRTYHEVGWFDASEVESVSSDGQTILFCEDTGTGATDDGYAQFIRSADQRPVLITHAFRAAVLPDASAVIAVSGPTKVSRILTKSVETRPLPLGTIAQLDISDLPTISWSGRHAVVRGAPANGAMQLWRLDLQNPSTPPEPVTSAHAGGAHPISPDGQTIAISHAAGGIELVSVVPGTPSRVITGPIEERPLSFTGDGTALFVVHIAADSLEIDRIELATGERTGWTRIVPEQKPVYYTVSLSADGENITYSTNSDSSDLYVLEPPSGP